MKARRREWDEMRCDDAGFKLGKDAKEREEKIKR